MKVILSVSDEGCFERTWWRLFWMYLMKVILSVSDEGYFECIWWRLFWASPDEGYFERTCWRLFWAFLMKVMLSVPNEGYSRNVSRALSLISTFLLAICIWWTHSTYASKDVLTMRQCGCIQIGKYYRRKSHKTTPDVTEIFSKIWPLQYDYFE